MVDSVSRHGKFLDIDAGGTHLVLHLARAGWVRWRDEVPPVPARPNSKSPLAARIVLDNGAGLDVTEAGTRKSLALYVVRDPQEVEGIARLGPDPLADDFTIEVLDEILQRAGRAQIKGVLRLPEQHRRHRQRLLRRAAARREDVAVQAGEQPQRGRAADAVRRDPRPCSATPSCAPRAWQASQLKGEKKSNMAVHGRTGEACPVCGDTVREVSFADSSLQYCATCQTGGKPLADRRMSKLLK